MQFNVNDDVWVRLTELGRQTYRDFWVRAAILTNTSKEMSTSAHLRIALAAIHRVVTDVMLELSPKMQGRPDPRPDPRPVEQPKAGQHDQQDGRDHPDGRRQRDDGADQPVDQREAKQHDDQLQHPAQVRASSSDATFLQRVRQIAANHGQRAMLGRLRFRQQAEQTTAGEDALLEILELAERLEPTPPLVVPGAS